MAGRPFFGPFKRTEFQMNFLPAPEDRECAVLMTDQCSCVSKLCIVSRLKLSIPIRGAIVIVVIWNTLRTVGSFWETDLADVSDSGFSSLSLEIDVLFVDDLKQIPVNLHIGTKT